MGRIKADAVPYRPPSGREEPSLGSRRVVFGGEDHETAVLHRPRLAPGTRREGPAVVEEDSSTTIVPPGYTFGIDDAGNLVITRT
jgi:N-methylhydantoinase A